MLRTLLQDRVAALNGRSVRHVLNQDLRAFVKLIALSTFQVRFPLDSDTVATSGNEQPLLDFLAV